MKKTGCSIIFFNDKEEILLLLRDDNPDILYPDMWDIPGGHVEQNETPEECISREMKEEMGLNLKDFNKFKVVEFSDRIEHVFWKRQNLEIDKIELTEGRYLKWFSKDDIRNIDLAWGFNRVALDFFRKKGK